VSEQSTIPAGAQAEEAAPVTKQKKERKRPVGFYIAGTWLGLVIFAAIFGPLLPLPAWDESFYDYLGARPGTSGHFLGTTQDGYDMLAGLVNGAKISASVSLRGCHPRGRNRHVHRRHVRLLLAASST